MTNNETSANGKGVTEDMLAKRGRYIPDVVRERRKQQALEQAELLDRVQRQSSEIVKLLRDNSDRAFRRREALLCTLIDLSNQSKVCITDPGVVEAFYLNAMLVVFRHPDRFTSPEVVDHIQAVLDPKTTAKGLDSIIKEYRCDWEDSPRNPAVVDLNCWRQSRPRPLKGVE